MSIITRPLATLIVIAGLLATATPASAAVASPAKTKSICPMPDVCILYNGHAGL